MNFIIESQSKQKYLLDLLRTQTIIGDTSFVSLSVYLNSLVESHREASWLRLAKDLDTIRQSSSLSILKDVLKYPMVVDQFSDFIQRMADEGWSLEDLPQRSEKEKELALCLTKLMDTMTEPFDQWKLFENVTLKDLSVLEHFYPYPIHKRLMGAMNQGLSLESLKRFENPLRSLRFTTNPRSEAQACVQELLKSSLPYESQSIVCLDPNLMDQVESFLLKYEIPYQKVGHGKAHPVFRFFSDVLRFKLNPNRQTLLDVIHNDVYSIQSKTRLIRYLEVLKLEWDELRQPLNRVESAFNDPYLVKILTKALYLSLEFDAETAFSAERDTLKTLVDTPYGSIQSFVSSCFEFCVSKVQDDDDTLKALLSLKDYLESAEIAVLEGMDHWAEFICYGVEKLSVGLKAQTGVILTDLAHAFIPGLKRQIWLSCTQANYPQFKTNSGLFDDAYVSGIKNYDLNERYRYHMDQLNELQTIAPEIIYSYALGSYDGKAQRLPYELETLLKDKVSSLQWDLYEEETEKELREPKLSVENSKRLYFSEGLKGSVTSFESYFHCPYKYFLHKGLHLNDEEDLSFDRLALGNLLHSLLDEGVKKAQNDYVGYVLSNLDALVKPYSNALSCLFSHDLELIKHIERKTLETLKLSLDFLADRDKNTAFEARLSEEAFDLAFPLPNGESIRFNGKIDRVDIQDQQGLIVDYKSSPMSFSEDKFMMGLKLQLPTYAYAMSQKGLDMMGAFYFSLSPQKVALTADPSFNAEAEFLSSRRLNGLIFDKSDLIDKSANHTVSFSFSKSGEISMPRPYDFEKTMHELAGLYQTVYDGLKAGKLHKQNLDNSCKYCPYMSFCQYKGPKMTIPKIKLDLSRVRKP